MYNFPENLYTDVRIEDVVNTRISYKKNELQEIKVRSNKGAFVRVYDGIKWYYTATTDMEAIQEAIDEMAKMAVPNKDVYEHPVVKMLEVNKDKVLQYDENSITDVPVEKKQKVIQDLVESIDTEHENIVNHTGFYVDNKTTKHFVSSKGTDVLFDKQTCGIRVGIDLKHEEETDSASYSKFGILFEDLLDVKKEMDKEFDNSIQFIKNAVNVEPGEYTVLMSPMVTGVFTHESFGHKSESDFMVGDENMKKEWALGKTIAQPLLNIIEDGSIKSPGYTLYDDEGTKCRENYIIKEGILAGRLHNAETASILEEGLTGNCRAKDFEYEPIVRMTTTYIGKGDRPLADIIGEIDKGIYVEDFKHGSGMSTFTIAPHKAYMIEDGKITTPVKVSVITGSVFETLDEIDAVSEEFEIISFVGGGCGKMEQFPLPVGFGGPYTRVKKLTVQ